jgi:hypothetical protein
MTKMCDGIVRAGGIPVTSSVVTEIFDLGIAAIPSRPGRCLEEQEYKYSQKSGGTRHENSAWHDGRLFPGSLLLIICQKCSPMSCLHFREV